MPLCGIMPPAPDVTTPMSDCWQIAALRPVAQNHELKMAELSPTTHLNLFLLPAIQENDDCTAMGR